MLRGNSKTAVPMWNMLLSAVVKIGAVMFLTVTPLNIVGAAWASNINFGLAALLNIIFLLRSGITFNVKVLAKTFGGNFADGCSGRTYLHICKWAFWQYNSGNNYNFCGDSRLCSAAVCFKSRKQDDLEKNTVYRF